VLHVRGDAVSTAALEIQYTAFESAGLVVIYSTETISPAAKSTLAAVAAKRFFDLSDMLLPSAESDAVGKVLTIVQSLRSAKDDNEPPVPTGSA
jgi:hypothetical protein